MRDATPEIINNVVMSFIIPPPMDRLHSSWRAIVYTKEQPSKIFHGTRNLPCKINPDRDIMKQELCDPDHIVAHIIQISEQEQYVYIESDVCEIIGTEIHMADGHDDPYLRKGSPASKPSAQPKSSIIIPGQQNQAAAALQRPNLVTTSQQAASLGASGPLSLEDAWIVDLTFKTSPVSDPEVVDKVKMVAWNHGLTI